MKPTKTRRTGSPLAVDNTEYMLCPVCRAVEIWRGLWKCNYCWGREGYRSKNLYALRLSNNSIVRPNEEKEEWKKT